jgi:hypothetical protein
MFAFFEDLTRDIRFGVRNLQKSAGLALMTGVSIALGIGATTAMYSVIYAVLLDPFPYKDVAHLLQRQSANGYGRLRRQLGTGLQHGRRSATLVMSPGRTLQLFAICSGTKNEASHRRPNVRCLLLLLTASHAIAAGHDPAGRR